MNAHTCKKLLALLLCFAMVFALLAGCKNEPPQPTDENGNIIPTGTLLLNFGAVMSLNYDNKGRVLSVSGHNEQGTIIADNLTGHVGVPTKELAAKLVNLSVDGAYLTMTTGSVLIRLGLTSALPYDKFIDELKASIQNTLDGLDLEASILFIDSSVMDEEGYFNVDILKTLVANHLGVEKLDAFYGKTTPSDGKYLCTVDAEEMQFSFLVDAFTGELRAPTSEELLGNPDDYIEEDPNVDSGNGYIDPDFQDEFVDIDIPLP